MRVSLLLPFTLFLGCAAVEPQKPELVRLELTPSQALVTSEAPAELSLRLQVRALELPDHGRAPLDLALLIDTSASMEGEPIAQARRAAEVLLKAMKDGDTLTVVSFDSTAELLVPPTVLDARSRTRIAERITRIEAKGTTDLAGGLAMVLRELSPRLGPEALHRVVLLSDGVPNDPAPIQGLAVQARQLGVAITTLGVGLEYDETLLAMVAHQTGGYFENIEDPAQVAQSFEAHVVHLEHLAARSAVLDLLPGPGVELVRVAGYDATAIAGRGRRIVLGDLEAGKERELYLQLRTTGHKDGLAVELCDAVLRYAEPTEAETPREVRAFAAVKSSQDGIKVSASQNAEVLRGAARAEAAAALLESVDLANSGKVAQAEARMDAGLKVASEALSRDPALERQVQEMREVKKAIPSQERLRSMKRSYFSASQAVH